MKNAKKWLVGSLTAACAAALCFGLVSCGGNAAGGKDSVKDSASEETPEVVSVVGGYTFVPADQGGYGLEVNLYEDGTYYYSQWTQKIFRGTYTATEATGTDAQGRSILYTVTFTEDAFAKEGETPVHNIVKDEEGVLYCTAMYDSMSTVSYDFRKGEFVEEIVQTVATYWSSDYENDAVKLTLYSNDTYALDGIHGAGQAGSMGTYTVEYVTYEETIVGVNYILQDEDNAEKMFTLEVGAEVKLTVGTVEYTMTDMDPDAVLMYEFKGQNSWTANVVLSCYSDSSCRVQVTMAGAFDFTDAKGTWSAPTETNDLFVFIFDGATVAGEKSEAGYTVEYTIANANFGGEKVTLTYAGEAAVEEATLALSLSAAAGDKSAKIELYSDGSWKLFVSYYEGMEPMETAKGTYATNAEYNLDMTVTADDAHVFASDSFVIHVSYETYQYGETINLNLATGAADFAFAQDAAPQD